MIFVTSNQSLSASSGIVNIPFLEGIYQTFMDEALLGLGGNRGQVIIHLIAAIQQDTSTQAQLPPQQYNPFFSRVPVPNQTTRHTGTKVTQRDVIYSAHIVVGPHIPKADDLNGVGHLNNNEAMITVVIEALPHINEAVAVSIEGRRYKVENSRPIGFSQRRYLMVRLTEIQETDITTPNGSIG